MLRKGTKLYSIFTGTCPVCQGESMYKSSNPYDIKNLFKMHDNCHHCGTKYKIEPSFFYGAMYVSYSIGVAEAIAFFVIGHLLLGLSLFQTFLLIAVALILAVPLTARLSRNIWINIFLHYKSA
ncbi:MAG: DUF983 domain-containing protein [Flavobacteriaceae bacterium]|nr:DUF983 domain-containing protein [Flavobacteriaceae bacterium]